MSMADTVAAHLGEVPDPATGLLDADQQLKVLLALDHLVAHLADAYLTGDYPQAVRDTIGGLNELRHWLADLYGQHWAATGQVPAMLAVDEAMAAAYMRTPA